MIIRHVDATSANSIFIGLVSLNTWAVQNI